MPDPTIQDVLDAIGNLADDVQDIKTKVNDLHPIKTKIDDMDVKVDAIKIITDLKAHSVVVRPGEVPPLP